MLCSNKSVKLNMECQNKLKQKLNEEENFLIIGKHGNLYKIVCHENRKIRPSKICNIVQTSKMLKILAIVILMIYRCDNH